MAEQFILREVEKEEKNEKKKDKEKKEKKAQPKDSMSALSPYTRTLALWLKEKDKAEKKDCGFFVFANCYCIYYCPRTTRRWLWEDKKEKKEKTKSKGEDEVWGGFQCRLYRE